PSAAEAAGAVQHFSSLVRQQLLVLSTFLLLFTALLFTIVPPPSRTAVAGNLATLFTVIMFGAPLSSLSVVLRTRSVEYMPLPLSLMSFVCSTSWMAYGIYVQDTYVIVPNSLGSILGIIQLCIYYAIRKTSSRLPSLRAVEEVLPMYAPRMQLGAGSFGRVFLMEHRQTGGKVAVKTLKKERIVELGMQDKVRREISILLRVRHPNVIRLYNVVETPKYILLLMEYAENGELFDYITQRGRLTEGEARRIFQQIVAGVEYCHRRMVVHRDLKPENILLDASWTVKIADFGLGNLMTEGHFLRTSCGSPNYAAPEWITQSHCGPEVHVWGCSVVPHPTRLPTALSLVHPSLLEQVISGRFYCGPEVHAWGCGVVLHPKHSLSLPTATTLPRTPPHPRAQVISGRFFCGPEVDVWGCGVVLHPKHSLSLPTATTLPRTPPHPRAQVISGRFCCGPEVDVWGCGVVLHPKHSLSLPTATTLPRTPPHPRAQVISGRFFCGPEVDVWGCRVVLHPKHSLSLPTATTLPRTPPHPRAQVISGRFYCGPEVDVWGCGVVLYTLLCGRLPFDEKSHVALYQKIKAGAYSRPTHVTPAVQDLLARLLVVDPTMRATIPEIRRHPWFLPWFLPSDLIRLQEDTAAGRPAAPLQLNATAISNLQAVRVTGEGRAVLAGNWVQEAFAARFAGAGAGGEADGGGVGGPYVLLCYAPYPPVATALRYQGCLEAAVAAVAEEAELQRRRQQQQYRWRAAISERVEKRQRGGVAALLSLSPPRPLTGSLSSPVLIEQAIPSATSFEALAAAQKKLAQGGGPAAAAAAAVAAAVAAAAAAGAGVGGFARLIEAAAMAALVGALLLWGLGKGEVS
ncbi:unnamed protein product, partial [Closterium sp. Naga37s-1]